MDHQKLDGALATELERQTGEEQRHYSVFVRSKTPISADAVAELRRLGVDDPTSHASVITLELSAAEIRRLSDRPWVSAIRLSRPLRPLR